MTPFVNIQESPLEPEKLRQAAKGPKSGAIVLFEGCVRDSHEGKAVAELFYEAYLPMALSQLEAIQQKAIAMFSLNACFIHHRIGAVPISESAIAIVCASAHRLEALRAAAWILDEIKESAPIWKRERYERGQGDQGGQGNQCNQSLQELDYSWVEGEKRAKHN
jgi:molybdopterin synthase catalytic subunit